MGKKAVVHIHNWILPAIKKNTFESVLMRWMKLEPITQSEVSQKEQHSILMHISGIQKDGNDDPIWETAKQTQMYRTVLWTLWEKAGVGWFEKIALKHVYYHMWNRSPVQVWCMRQGAQGWCTGMTQRDGIRREVWGAFRMGNTCASLADLCWCLAKITTIL